VDKFLLFSVVLQALRSLSERVVTVASDKWQRLGHEYVHITVTGNFDIPQATLYVDREQAQAQIWRISLYLYPHTIASRNGSFYVF
jgi:hypothetical protein